MVTSELGRWSRTAENTTEFLTSIISITTILHTDMGGNSHNVIMLSKGNGNVLVKEKSLHN
jgi:hypothetical protein